MKALFTLFTVIAIAINSIGQAPTLHIHIVSHNEPNDNLQTPINYARAKQNALQLAQIIDIKNARWNLQTSDGFVMGARTDQNQTGTNIFHTLAQAPYNDNIQIDPRYKNFVGRNIADQYYLLDSLGANPTTHLGGCIYSTTNQATAPIDWLQYRQPIIGNVHGNSWQCSIITGAGSFPPHLNDLNDFGVFKPDTTTNFYHHNPSKNLWCMGTGCAPVLDSLDDAQAIIDLIQGQVDSIQNGLWPQNKFYVTRIMTNQRQYGPMFFQKISMVIDSLNLLPTTHLQWATIGECFTAFENWESTTGNDHSQYLCGEAATDVANMEPQAEWTLYPNPATNHLNINSKDLGLHRTEVYDAMGKMVFKQYFTSSMIIDISNFGKGIYIIKIDGATQLFEKQ